MMAVSLRTHLLAVAMLALRWAGHQRWCLFIGFQVWRLRVRFHRAGRRLQVACLLRPVFSLWQRVWQDGSLSPLDRCGDGSGSDSENALPGLASSSSESEGAAPATDSASLSESSESLDGSAGIEVWANQAEVALVDWEVALCATCQTAHDARLCAIMGESGFHPWALEMAIRFCCVRCGRLELCLECVSRLIPGRGDPIDTCSC